MNRTAFVLGGGGVLGAVEVGMLRALAEADIKPDIILGTSVGALNGALVAADPGPGVIERLLALWQSAAAGKEVYSDGAVRQMTRAVRTGTHLHSAKPLRARLEQELGDLTFDQLVIPFQCCAACIERACEHWFTEGRVVDAVVASAAVPGLLRPARVGDEHFLDGGIVNSIPVGRAVEVGADRIFVLQVVGRADHFRRGAPRDVTKARANFPGWAQPVLGHRGEVVRLIRIEQAIVGRSGVATLGSHQGVRDPPVQSRPGLVA